MPGEASDRRAGWIATITALVVVAGFIAGKAARDAILLSSFSIKTLPIFITISALISFPVILVAGRLMTRFGPARLMPPLNVISAALVIVEWYLLPRFPRPATVAIYFHISTSGAVLVSGFWSMINERFDVQSAKRHIGRIGMGATLGGIAGGIIAERTAVYLSANAILLVLAALQLTCAVTLFASRGARGLEGPPASAPRFALGVVTRSPLLRNLGLVVVLGAIAACVLDYVFKADLVATSSKMGLLRSLALYYTATSVLTAIVQVAVSGPLLARLGVPRSVATLPLVVTAFGAVALAVPAVFAALAARAAETITRSSIYRAGYELLYAPLLEADKRPTKIVLDVGAERVGDLVGAQLVALIVYVMVDPRAGLLVATVITGAITFAFALRLRRNYTLALEHSLVAQSDGESEPRWPIGAPIVGQDGALSPLPLRILRHPRRRAVPVTATERDELSATIVELRSRDPARIKRALTTELSPELAALVVGFVAREDVGREALAALRVAAPRCTGMLVDALLDATREIVVRRRLPDVLLTGEPSLAAWGLWRGLADPSFEVRYRCGVVLAQLAHAGTVAQIASETVFEIVRRELVVDPIMWKTRPVGGDDVGSPLEHVFTILGLILPPEPLRIALAAVQADDSALRATALEYLESILPADVRAQLWPLLEADAVPDRSPRSQDELVAAMHAAYQARRAAELVGSAT